MNKPSKNLTTILLACEAVAICVGVGVWSLSRPRNPVTPSPAPSSSVNVADIAVPPETASPPTRVVSRGKWPSLEQNRQDTEKSSDDTVQIVSGFECSTPIAVQKLSPTHFQLTPTSSQLKDWFMFRVEGAKGKTIRFDLSGSDVPVENWSSLNPVYTYADDLDDSKPYVGVGNVDAQPSLGWNGPLLPATDGQQWHYIANAWTADPDTFSFVQDFNSDNAYIAMRVPHPPGYNELFFQQLAANPNVKVIEVGRSSLNRPLLLAKIGTGGEDAEKTKPCIVVYAGEHADEQDAMWVAQGAVEYLVSDSPDARQLRDRFTFLVIPMLDPDGSTVGMHTNIIMGFLSATKTCESVAYANWFQAWVNAGKRLDLVFDLHNVQSREQPHVSCPLMETFGVRGKASETLNTLIMKALQNAGFTVNPQPWARGWSPDRLGGWLDRRYGALTIAYEVNCQAAGQHLNLQHLKQIGTVLSDGVPGFLSSTDGAALLADVDLRRQQRLDRWAKSETQPAGIDAIEAEAKVSNGIGRQKTQDDELLIEKWVN